MGGVGRIRFIGRFEGSEEKLKVGTLLLVILIIILILIIT